MYAVSFAVSKIGRASGRFFQRQRQSNEELPHVQVTENKDTSHDNECSQSQETHMPLSYSCCMRWAWPAVTFRCTTHPHEVHVSVRDKNGDTALHWACFGKPPLDAIEALLTACPELVSTTNDKGELPLHVACSYRASSDVIRALLRAYPEGAGTPNGDGSYPMHILCDYGCVVDSVRAVLETSGGVNSLQRQDCIYRRTPIMILHARRGANNAFTVLRDERAKYAVDDTAQHECPRIQEFVANCKKFELWQKAALLILAEYRGSPLLSEETVNHKHIVHACAGIHECPPSLLEYALLLYPEQLLIKDERGQLPLHIAASHQSVANAKEILRTCPQACKIRNQEGRIAIEIAVESGWSWSDGVGQLLLANPTSLEVLNMDERLYPWIWSSLSRKPQGNTSALYESLRARPSIVS